MHSVNVVSVRRGKYEEIDKNYIASSISQHDHHRNMAMLQYVVLVLGDESVC